MKFAEIGSVQENSRRSSAISAAALRYRFSPPRRVPVSAMRRIAGARRRWRGGMTTVFCRLAVMLIESERTTSSLVRYVILGEANRTSPSKINRTPMIFSHSASARLPSAG
jgi:hypothetical protein